MANTATRLFNLIAFLQRHPNSSASQLAHALEVSPRTVQRYIVALEEMGVPIYAERGSHGGYSLVRGYRMPPLMLTPEEAVAVHLGTGLIEYVWGKLFRGSAMSALTKIENVLPEEQLQEIAWARGNLITQGIPRINPNLDMEQLETLYQAVRQGFQVEILYQGKNQDSAIWRRINPYVLVYSWGQQYCVADCQLRGAMRSFRVDRIQAMKRLDTVFAKPTDFDPAQYLDDHFEGQSAHEVRLLFRADTANVAHDYRCCWESFEERADGSVIAGFRAPDLDAATRRVMCFLTDAKVIAPVELKTLVGERARAIAAQYAPEPREDAALVS
ncbi:helix-turn-helix transcriptional regulator [Marinimicrobium agarilyticum]|uniref:helix-turn-helix transcriptional regulator n=1 Tax=Marinimicrobium agarilyticum TaxID=306546 RepID=UPI00041B76C0|nr:YafY family protein [Marinimicrobium agarilyticum]